MASDAITHDAGVFLFFSNRRRIVIMKNRETVEFHEKHEPLASQLRPLALDDFVGQEHLVGEGKPLRIAITQRHLFSLILWGPPGVGKTTLARIYANGVGARFYDLSAVSASKADIKTVVDEDTHGEPKVLFLDEIHRFNKAQQDYLLPFVESGKLTLIGATTENPSFEVIPALLSRCRVFTLREHPTKDMHQILTRASKLSRSDLDIDEEAKEWLVAMAAGDARQMLSVVDATYALYKKITVENLKQTIQSTHLRYDKAGEEHHNTVSAFIKSMRASQRDAAIYYLARMVSAGEDPLFIARRMVIFASEDIGPAQPTALVVANAVFRACETVGYPECAINLAHGVEYLASAKKDRSAYDALRAAQADVEARGNLPIPLSVRNAPTKLMKDMGYGKDYEMYDKESYLPDELKGKKYFN
jgi:putative ATPase